MVILCGRVRDFGVGVALLVLHVFLFPPRRGGLREGGVDGPLDTAEVVSEKSPKLGVEDTDDS